VKEIRWLEGERIFKETPWLPGFFIFVFAAVIFAKWTGHVCLEAWRFAARRLIRRALIQPPQPKQITWQGGD
jgi:hypothetical protein